jgi:hypothetical protein
VVEMKDALPPIKTQLKTIQEKLKPLQEKYNMSHVVEYPQSKPIYQKKIAYGSRGFPWFYNGVKSKVSYKKGICPVAENLHNNS